ncbi:MAG TPA: hypothetical protein VJJ23_00670 [Candidatus Nanoarchaeia archaeon]|nr:hypothetical protein [Candidatus Nanoarchaeia archaeon]
MSITVVPEMDPSNLEKILEVLPEPQSMEVYLFGEFDYTSVARQAEHIVPGLKIYGQGILFEVEKPSKETVLELYKISQKAKDGTKDMRQRRIDLAKLEWYLDKHVHIELTPTHLDVTYSGKEPGYVTFLRNVLVHTGIRLKIENDNAKYGKD